MILSVSHTDDNIWPTSNNWLAFFEPIVKATLDHAHKLAPVWVSVLLSHDPYVRTLNNTYRGKDKPTNVLSFPMDAEDDLMLQDDPDEPRCLGDVVLSFETIEREAKEANILFEAHAAHMMVHGVLHLLGFQHETDEEAEEMETLECRIMKHVGYANPYPDRASL